MHYILTDETKEIDGHILHRIKCTETFGNVEKGELGGFVESTSNLIDDAWVSDNACVFENAIVSDRASSTIT